MEPTDRSGNQLLIISRLLLMAGGTESLLSFIIMFGPGLSSSKQVRWTRSLSIGFLCVRSRLAFIRRNVPKFPRSGKYYCEATRLSVS